MRSISKSEFVVAKVTISTKKYFATETSVQSVGIDDAVIILLLTSMEGRHIRDFLHGLVKATEERKLIMKDPVCLSDLAMVHGASFENIVDADAVAANLGWSNRSFDIYSQKMFGKGFCMRGSALPARGRPSEVALET